MPGRRRRRAMFRTGGALGLALTVMACASSGSRPPGVPGPAEIRLRGGHVLVEAEYRKPRSRVWDDTRNALLAEEVGIEMEGHAYHPRFLRFNLDGALRLEHATSRPEGGDVGTALSPRGEITVNLLPEHPYPMRFHALRIENRHIVQSLTGSPIVRGLREEVGARVDVIRAPFRASASARHSEHETTGLDQDRSESRNTVEIDISHDPSAQIQSRIRADLEWVADDTGQDDYESHRFVGENTVELGQIEGRPRATFRTRLDGRIRRGRFEEDQLRASESVDLAITVDLDSLTHVDLAWFESDVTTYRRTVSQRFTHRLYKSLLTTADFHHLYESSDVGDVEQAGASLGVDYRKSTPLGPLALGYRGGFDRQTNALDDTRLQVNDEGHRLATDTLVLLDRLDVDHESVIVRSAGDGTIFLVDLDYRLRRQGRRTEVIRGVAGAIPDGSEVLVSYSYSSPRDLTFDTRRDTFSLGLVLFDVLLLRAFRGFTENDVVAGESGEQLEDSDVQLYEAKLSAEGVRAEIEWEDQDATRRSYRRLRGEIAYDHTTSAGTDMGFSVTHQESRFEEGTIQRVLTIQGRLRTRLGSTGSLMIMPAFRRERGGGLDRDVFDVRALLRYRYGQIRLELDVRYLRDDHPGSGIDDALVLISVERRW